MHDQRSGKEGIFPYYRTLKKNRKMKRGFFFKNPVTASGGSKNPQYD
jgi:hypothetical protein